MFEEELTALTEKCRGFIRSGSIDRYSKTLKEIAALFHNEGRLYDQLKMLFLSFYIDLSGFGRAAYIDRQLIKDIQSAVSTLGLDIEEIEQLYLLWIQPEMITRHTMSINDSWYLMQLCINDKIEQAEWALTKV